MDHLPVSEVVTALINFLSAPTCHAVTRIESFVGFGNEPSLTFRHKVAELNGKSGGGCGFFGFRDFELFTNCDSRTKALSGNSSNDAVLFINTMKPHTRLGRFWIMSNGQALRMQLWVVVATLRRLDYCTDLMSTLGAESDTSRITSLIFCASKLFGEERFTRRLTGVLYPI
jgi:hypothetical protein